MNIYAVIGSGYGDEGKGVFTNYFSNYKNNFNSLTIRYNGGAQAGHTVISKNIRHVFNHFGSNMLNANSATALSQFFVCNPNIFLKEKNILKNKTNKDINNIYVHKKSYITTPFDILINQILEKSRNNGKHGSCGLGFGQTIERNEINKITLNYEDLYNLSNNELFYKIKEIQNYFFEFIDNHKLNNYIKNMDFLYNNIFLDNIIKELYDFKENTILYEKESNLFNQFHNIVFEGAQGLELDQDYGDFPHVTRSNTGLKNIISILQKNNIQEKLNISYITRAYKTRHGAGKLKNELFNLPYQNVIDKTNINNEYQGNLRFAYLDFNQLKKAIDFDLKYINNIDYNLSLGISCLDQSNIIKYYLDEKKYEINNNLLSKELLNYLNIENSFDCYGPEGNIK